MSERTAEDVPQNGIHNGETQPLLAPIPEPADAHDGPILSWKTIVVPVLVVVALIVGTVLVFVLPHPVHPLLDRVGVVDTHIDLPILLRSYYRNNLSNFDLSEPMPGHVDIPRLRRGRVAGVFWSVYVGCSDDVGEKQDENFLTPTYRVRDTLEQIDVTKLFIQKWPDTFALATSTASMREAIIEGKIASLIGVEGGHQLENSLGVLRMYYDLGARYMTLTHSCNNAFADSAGIGSDPKPLHFGLSPFGYDLILEMNRLGMMVDISHVSDATAVQAFKASRAPLLWSHSSARAVWPVRRNIPDDILSLIGFGEGKKDAVVMINFAPDFVAGPGLANVSAVADHVEHVAQIAGWKHVGIGSDYDGIPGVPKGLEDVSKYPSLFEEMRRRGWNDIMLAGLAQYNFLRVFEGVERVAREMHRDGFKPVMTIYDKREDL